MTSAAAFCEHRRDHGSDALLVESVQDIELVSKTEEPDLRESDPRDRTGQGAPVHLAQELFEVTVRHGDQACSPNHCWSSESGR